MTIIIKKLDNKEENWVLLKDAWLSFHENAPTNSCIDGFQTAECREILELCLRDMVQSADCPVVIAWDDEKEKVAGMSIHQLDRRNSDQSIPYHDRPGTFKYGKYDWPEATKADFQKETDFYLNHLILKLEFFNRYQVDTCWNLSLLSVLPEYGGQGLGQRITEYSLQIAKDMGAEMARSSFASAFSQKIGLKCGFKPVITASYEQCYGNYHKMSADIKARHKTCVTMVKHL